ncbi:MAG TPA: DUF1579 family protein, partial [Gemmatimonadaceae bacterium]
KPRNGRHVGSIGPRPPIELPTPNPGLARFDFLVGGWDVRGRLRGSAEDDISGWANCEWMPGGFFLEYRSEINLRGVSMFSFQMIGYDPATQKFTSSVYTSMDETPMPEEWDVQGRTVSIRARGMTYAGVISDDGNSLAGGWRPSDETGAEELSYDAVMTRATPRIVREPVQ